MSLSTKQRVFIDEYLRCFNATAAARAARLTSFPDLYGFPNSPHQNRAAIGNSVPPLFMEAIARHIRHEILEGTT